MRKSNVQCLSLLFVLFSYILVAQENEIDLYDHTDYQLLKSQDKSVGKAMMLSAIFPGTGQFYVNKRSFWTYFFPAIEVSLFIMAKNYDKKGDKLTKKFEKFANEHYDQSLQNMTQLSLIGHPSSNRMYGSLEEIENGILDQWGNGGYFRLDRSDKQHYYEDIGKYNKYIYGWSDWQNNFVAPNGSINWIFNDNGIWIGNVGVNPNSPDFDIEVNHPYSELRAQYFKIRDDANDAYYTRQSMYFLVVLNHGISTYHANRVVKAYNKKVNLQPKYSLSVINDNIVPIIGFVANF